MLHVQLRLLLEVNLVPPSCDIRIVEDTRIEASQTFSLSAAITNTNGQLIAQFTAGGDSVSATIVDDDGMLVVCFRLKLKYLILQLGMYSKGYR